MNLFAVRIPKNQQPVGFFWAASKRSLMSMVDAVADPDECEYKLMTQSAAMVWSDDEDWKMGVNEDVGGEIDADERDSKVMGGVGFEDISGGFLDYVSGQVDVGGWVPLDDLPEDFANVEQVLVMKGDRKEESEVPPNVVLNPSSINEPAKRAVTMISNAFQEFIIEEEKRLGENTPVVTTLGNAVGAGLAAVVSSRGFKGNDARKLLEASLSVAKDAGENFLEWYDNQLGPWSA